MGFEHAAPCEQAHAASTKYAEPAFSGVHSTAIIFAQVSSISGSSSEEEDEEDEGGAGPGRQQRGGAGSGQPPQSLFEGPEGKQFCVWTCLLEKDHVRGHDEGSAGKVRAAQSTSKEHLTEPASIYCTHYHFAAAYRAPASPEGARALCGASCAWRPLCCRGVQGQAGSRCQGSTRQCIRSF